MDKYCVHAQQIDVAEDREPMHLHGDGAVVAVMCGHEVTGGLMGDAGHLHQAVRALTMEGQRLFGDQWVKDLYDPTRPPPIDIDSSLQFPSSSTLN